MLYTLRFFPFQNAVVS